MIRSFARVPIAIKTSVAVALAIAVGFMLVAYIAAASQRATLLRQADHSVSETTMLLGSVAAGGVRFGRTDAIERAYADFVDNPEVALSRIETWRADGTRITQWQSDRFADHATGRIGRIGQSINNVSLIAAAIAEAITVQGEAARSIVRNVHQVAATTGTVSRWMVAMRADTEESGPAATRVLDASPDLAAQANLLRGEVGSFVRGIGANESRRRFERITCRMPSSILVNGSQVAACQRSNAPAAIASMTAPTRCRTKRV